MGPEFFFKKENKMLSNDSFSVARPVYLIVQLFFPCDSGLPFHYFFTQNLLLLSIPSVLIVQLFFPVIREFHFIIFSHKNLGLQTRKNPSKKNVLINQLLIPCDLGISLHCIFTYIISCIALLCTIYFRLNLLPVM